MEVVDVRKTGVVERITGSELYKKILAVKNLRIIVLSIIIAMGLIIYSGVATNTKTEEVNYMDDEENRLASVLESIDGVGAVQVMITRNDGQISGVLVIAEGAENISVMLKLLDATSTAMGVDKSIVEVYQME